MPYSIPLRAYADTFAVPRAIVDRHLKLAGSAQLKVMLLLLRHPERAFEAEEVAAAVGLAQEDAADALHYWLACGLLQRSDAASSPAEAEASAPPAEPPAASPPEPAPVLAPVVPRALPAEPVIQVRESEGVKIISSEIPRLRSEEITRRRREDAVIRFLLDEAEPRLGRQLTTTDLSTIVSLHDWAGMDADVILMLLEFCTRQGKNSARSNERTALKFIDRGIDTHERAENYIREQELAQDRYHQVQRAFGIGDRKLIKSEREQIDRWFGAYGYDLPMIECAYERCVENTGKLSFAYIDKTLAAWKERGLHTPAEAEAERQSYKQKRKEAEGVKPSYDSDRFEADSLMNVPIIKKRSRT